MASKERLERLVSHRAGLSRKDARLAIRKGRVRVDGQRVQDPSLAVSSEAMLQLDARMLTGAPLLAILHKPAGVQSTVGDPWGRENLETLAAELLSLGLHPVGRLDADTEGLLPFSRNGALTQRLLHPNHAVEKVYVAKVEGEPDPELEETLRQGVETAEGIHQATLIDCHGSELTLSVTEGKHRMVRRMLANAGFPVLALRRIAFGPMQLGNLPVGGWRMATAEELAWAEALIG